ncbi:MAG: DUF3828 domain-containing protein [Devosia sp.]|jgi:hypothetical protein
MRLVVLAAGLFAALTGMALAQPYETPEALLEAFYQPYMDGNFAEDDSVFRSQALQALYDHDAEITPEGEIGAIDFDPFINGQDYSVSNLVIGAAGIAGDYASVTVTFDNFDQPQVLDYDLVREGDGWKIDDVASAEGEYPYRLSEIFAMAAGN